jgi:zinc protease
MNMLPRARWVAIVVAALGCAPVQAPKVKPFEYQGYAANYPTGLRLVAYELPHSAQVMVSVSYRVGSVDDPPGQEGLAHLAEHMTFRARPAMAGAGRLWDRFVASSPEFNAETWADHTDYWEVGAPEQLDELLALEAARLRDPLAGVTEEDFARERLVVLRELAERRDPGAQATQLDWLLGLALAGNPYGRNATRASIAAIGWDDVKAFVRAHYTPAHAIVAVTGPRRAREVGQRTLAAFGTLADPGVPASSVPPVVHQPPVPASWEGSRPEGIEVRRAPVVRPTLWLAWTMPGDYAREAPRAIAAAEFVTTALWSAKSWHGWRDRAEGIDAWAERMDGVTLVVARVQLRREEDASKIVDGLRTELGWRGRTGASAARIGGALRRDELLLDSHLSLEQLDVHGIAQHLRSTGEPDYIQGWQRLVAFQLSKGVDDYVAHYIRADRVTAMLVAPDRSATATATLEQSGFKPIATIDHHASPASLVPPGADVRQVARSPGLASVFRRRLKNGLEVVIARRGAFRLARVELVIGTDPAGNAQEVLEELGLISTSRAWIEDELRILSSSIHVASGVRDDHLWFRAGGPSERLGFMLEATAYQARKRYMNGPLFERIRDVVAEAVDREPLEPQHRAARELLARLYPGHPYSEVVRGDVIRDLRTRQVGRWLDANYRPDRAALLIVGDVEPSPELLERVQDLFGGWDADDPRPQTSPPPPPLPMPARSVAVVDRPGWPSAEILLGIRIPPRRERDTPAFDALAWHLRFGLQEQLRVAEGATYGVNLGVHERALGSAFLVATVVDPARAGPSLAAILEALQEMAGRALTPEELAGARWQVARRYGAGFSTVARTTARLEEIAVDHLPPDHWDVHPLLIASLSPERVQAVARAASIGREAVVLIGDAAVLVPQLRKLGLEPVVLPPDVDSRSATRVSSEPVSDLAK